MVDFINLYNNPDTDRTTLTANVTIAASMSSIMVESTDLLQVGINIFMSDGVEFVYATVTAINSPTDFDADKISGSANALVIDSGATVQVVGPEGTAGFSSPLTTKGDILTYDTADTRLGVGADGQVLTANSATSEGIEWTTPSSAGIETQEEGVQVDAAATTLNFVGSGVTATDAGSNVTTVTIPGGTSGVATEDEGISVDPAATTLNFVGAGVTATDAGSNVTTVTIPGGGGSSPLTTKGDLYTYDTADQRLPIGTDGQILSANSATSTGLEWIANTGGGSGGGGHSEDFGDGVATSFVITHNLGTKDVVVSCWDNTTPFDEVYPTVSHTSDNTVTLDFGATVPTTDQYRVFVTSGGGGGSGNSGLTALTANTTVNVTDFATLETEINNLAGINLNGFDYTIQCADGTYTFANDLEYVSPIGAGNVIIKGNVADETLVDLATGSFQFVNTSGNTQSELKFEDVQFTGDGSTGMFSIGSKSVVSVNKVKFGSSTTNNVMAIANDSLVLIRGDIDISGISVARFALCDQAVLRSAATATIDVTGSTWTSNFVRAIHLAYIRLDNGLITYTGSATGQRFDASFNGVVQTNTGGGATTLPGDSSGSTSSGGQYN